jgi:Winged helix DNA-binding domain
LTAPSLRRLRAAAQLLHRPRRSSPAALVGRLLAVQAQDLRAARLALRARCAGLTVADVDAALTDRSLVVAWLGRGTLHLVGRDDFLWLLALTAPARLTANRRRLGQEGVPLDAAERAVAVIERALADEGPLTRPELAERVAARGTRTEGQATPHLLMLAALRGIAVLGPVRPDGAQAFAHVLDWLGAAPPSIPLAPPERKRALAELARRYLGAHGPAMAADLAAWAGLPVRDARAGLGAIAAELDSWGDGGDLVDLATREPAPERIPPRLLPAFDPYLLGWKDRGFAVPAEHARRVHPGGGILRATATDDGVAVGTWSLRGGTATVDQFEPLPAETAAALEAEAADVARFVERRPPPTAGSVTAVGD